MGHREDLLEGAKRCLLEKGYARTTARDIVAASGTNLASIGYHYGSKEALLNQAFLAVTEEWGDAVGPGGKEGAKLPSDPLERFEKTWEQVIASFDSSRPVWKLQLEVVSRLDEDEQLRDAIRGPQEEGRQGMAEGFGGLDPKADPEKARVAGLFYQALVAGVMIQWLVDPDTAPSAKELTDGLLAVLEDRSAQE
ncbi:TetR/AcrR family transcriptional regulator [Streptomyces sp. NBC_00829]|uniref:TetR/AcrR family transcriptional regulator n=1 Tax=Streptomyces sp. NBC_00829 TaxID=2903679 RepID=UPI003869DE92|nr:TetR/AcrR family transcriptional regulator [Streptomyces sp. NBC_00829]